MELLDNCKHSMKTEASTYWPKQNEKNPEEVRSVFFLNILDFAACRVSCYAFLKHTDPYEADGLSKWGQVHQNC